MTIDIIGAGIGGLTTAIALNQKGIKTRVFEQAEQIKPVGAGIILANNAMQVYEKLGLRKIIEEKGNPIASINITKPSLKLLSQTDLTCFEEQYNAKNIAIHRGALQQILVNKLSSDSINYGHKLNVITKNKKGYCLQFENGEQVESSIVLGADGLNSSVRESIFPNSKIRHANQICWRGLIEYKLPINYKNELNEAWGESARFGFVQIAENTVYWYALKTLKENEKEFSVNKLEIYFKDYSAVIKDIIRSTKKQQIHTTKISDLKPMETWFKENICLIGDAAHATTPNLGQGACQAIEDAFVISECLDKYEINKAFSEFQKLRLSKVHRIVNTSWLVGKMAHLKNPVLVGLRNQMLRLTPASVNRKQNEHIFKLAGI